VRGEGLLTTRGEGLLTDCERRRAADCERRRAADYERRRGADYERGRRLLTTRGEGLTDYERESVIQHSVNIHASLKHDRWPGDRGRVMEYLKHNTLRPWSFRPASLSVLRTSSKILSWWTSWQ
jgi:hypothetical protein